MKRTIRFLFIFLVVLFLCGCTTDYKRKDIINYVKKEIGIRNFGVSKTYEIIRDSDGYRDRYWNVYDRDNDVEFYVKDDYYYSSEMTNNSLEDNYYDMYYIKHESKLNKNRNLSYKEIAYDDVFQRIELSCLYKNRKELGKCFDSVKYLRNYFNDKSHYYYELKYNFNGRKEDALVNYSADYIGNTYGMDDEDTDYYNYFYNGILFDNDSIISEMSSVEYNSVLNDSRNYKLVKTIDSGSIIKEYDKAFCLNSYSISYNSLYKALKDEGYNVVGDSHSYKVYYKNSVYEFSDSFVEYSLSKGHDAYYYKKNGEKIYAYYGHDWERILFKDDIKKMFDLQLECNSQKN